MPLDPRLGRIALQGNDRDRLASMYNHARFPKNSECFPDAMTAELKVGKLGYLPMQVRVVG